MRRGLFLIPCLFVMVASVLYAQDEDPLPDPQPAEEPQQTITDDQPWEQTQVDPNFQSLHIDKISGDTFIRGSYRKQNETISSGVTSHTSDFFLEEGVHLRSRGFAYHRNFLEWYANAVFGFNQQDIEDDSVQQNSNGTLYGYDLGGTFLREKPVSLRWFSSYQNDFTDRDFANRLELETFHHGVEFMHRGLLESSLLLDLRDKQELNETRNTN